MTKKYFTFADLRAAMKEAGLPHSKVTLMRWEQKGILKLRRAPHSGWRLITGDEMEQIVTAFAPGGKGFWRYDEN